jgi:hypothetical protein
MFADEMTRKLQVILMPDCKQYLEVIQLYYRGDYQSVIRLFSFIVGKYLHVVKIYIWSLRTFYSNIFLLSEGPSWS